MNAQKLKTLVCPRDVGFSKTALIEVFKALDPETMIVGFYDGPHNACTYILLSNPSWVPIKPNDLVPAINVRVDLMGGKYVVEFIE